jgi:hypothetical protein
MIVKVYTFVQCKKTLRHTVVKMNSQKKLGEFTFLSVKVQGVEGECTSLQHT